MEQRSSADRRSVERNIDHILWRLAALDEWRKDMDGRMSVLESNVETEKQVRMLAEAVNLRKEKDVRIGFTGLQKIGALLVALIVTADSIKGLIGL